MLVFVCNECTWSKLFVVFCVPFVLLNYIFLKHTAFFIHRMEYWKLVEKISSDSWVLLSICPSFCQLLQLANFTHSQFLLQNIFINFKEFWYNIFFGKGYLYPTQRVAEGIMFLTRPSVSQSVSPSVLFFLLAQLLWNRSTEFRETL